MEFKDVRVFLSEETFSVIEYDPDQHSGLLSPVGVLQQGYPNVLVTDH